MSNTGQALTAVVGGVIGFYVGGPTGAAYGFQLGLLAGSALFPTQLAPISGPRLTDLRTTTSELGAGVPIPFGIIAVPGVIDWLGPIVEHENTESQGGKGGPEQSVTTFAYTQSIGIGLCEGPIIGVRRIWENGKLVYDISPLREGESSDDYDLRIAANTDYEPTFVLYLGTETQEPDPTMELAEGVGEVPPMLGLARIVYPDRHLRADQALRHPNFRFEVFTHGDLALQEVTQYSNGEIYPWLGHNDDPRNPANNHRYLTSAYVAPGDPSYTYPVSTHFSDLGDEVTRFVEGWQADPANNAPYPEFSTYLGYSGGPFHLTNRLADDDLLPPNYRGPVFMHFNRSQPNAYIGLVDSASPLWLHPCEAYASLGLDYGPLYHSNISGYVYNSYADGTYGVSAGGYALVTLQPYSDERVTEEAFASCQELGFCYRIEQSDLLVHVSIDYRKPDNPCHSRTTVSEDDSDHPGEWCFIEGHRVKDLEWTQFPEFSEYVALRRYETTDTDANPLDPPSLYPVVTQYPLNPTRPVSHPDNNQAFWERAYARAVINGDMAPELVYGVHYPQALDPSYPGYYRTYTQLRASAEETSLADIVTALCGRVGLTPSDIDVSDLEPITVWGYAIPHPMPDRSALDPLRSVGFFDVVESGGIVKFCTRGKAEVAALSADDLGAVEAGSDPPPAVTTREIQDVELPRTVGVRYLAPSRDYEMGMQASPSRLTTDAVNDAVVDIAVALDDERAARIAEVLWSDSWASRWLHNIALDSAWLALDPADCVTIPIDGRTQRVRFGAIEEAALLLRKISCVRDDRNGYVSRAIAVAPERVPQSMSVYSRTALYLLDLPLLRDIDNDAGIYAASKSTGSGNTWRGALVRRSSDGESFADVATMAATAYIGILVTPPAAGPHTTWDESAEIVVDMQSGALESRTESAVLSGGNLAAIGADGRWLLVQFRDAVEIATDRWRLTGLLQGRRGTEHFIGTALADDAFILMSGPGITRIALGLAQIGTVLTYRAMTSGAPESYAVDQSFTGRGLALKPFSPVQIAGTRDGSENLTVTFTRRGRIGQEMPDGIDIPLSEASEAYEAEILDGADTVVRTITGITTTTFDYSAADQTTDLGAPQSLITLRIYQLSDVVGRGTPGEATV